MSVVLDKVTEIQDQVIDYLGSVKEPVVNGVETVVGFVMGTVFPQIPAVPFADKLSTPAEVVDAEFACSPVASSTPTKTLRLLSSRPPPR